MYTQGHPVTHALRADLRQSRRIMYHIRRGDLIEEEYWNKFFATGSVKDYLSYKMQESADEKGQMKEKSVGVSNCESDCTDRHGALHHAGGRI